MIVEPDFFTHYKTRELIGLTGRQEAPLRLQMLWAYCHQRMAWAFREMTPHRLAAICMWDGDPDLWIRSLEKAGWIRIEADGTLWVHAWEEYNRALLQRWRNGMLKAGMEPTPFGPKKLVENSDRPGERQATAKRPPSDRPGDRGSDRQAVSRENRIEENRREEVPLKVPLKGDGESLTLRLRLCRIFRHRDERTGDAKVNRAWGKAEASGAMTPDAVRTVEAWYAARDQIPPAACKRHGFWWRSALPQMLNNWADDVETCRRFLEISRREKEPPRVEAHLLGASGGEETESGLAAAYLR